MAVIVLAKLATNNSVPFLSVLTRGEESGQRSKREELTLHIRPVCSWDESTAESELGICVDPHRNCIHDLCVCVCVCAHTFIPMREGFWFSSASYRLRMTLGPEQLLL